MTISLEHALATTIWATFSQNLQISSTAKRDYSGTAVYILLSGVQHGVLASHLIVQVGSGLSWNRQKRQKWPLLWSKPLRPPFEPLFPHFYRSLAQLKEIHLGQLYISCFQTANIEYWYYIGLFRSALGSPKINLNVKNDHFSGARSCDHHFSHFFLTFTGL